MLKDLTSIDDINTQWMHSIWIRKNRMNKTSKQQQQQQPSSVTPKKFGQCFWDFGGSISNLPDH